MTSPADLLTTCAEKIRAARQRRAELRAVKDFEHAAGHDLPLAERARISRERAKGAPVITGEAYLRTGEEGQ